jgi:hypothetical protein
MLKENNRWYLPRTALDASDAIDRCKDIIHFLCDTLAQDGFKPGHLYSLTDEGVNGLCQIYGFIEDVLDISNDTLYGEGREKTGIGINDNRE